MQGTKARYAGNLDRHMSQGETDMGNVSESS